MRLATAFATAALLATALASCGGSSSTSGGESQGRSAPDGGSTAPRSSGAGAPAGAAVRSCAAQAGGVAGMRVTGVACAEAGQVARDWRAEGACSASASASRGSCAVRAYRCLSVRTDRGLAVSCSRPGRAIAFDLPRRAGPQ